ncbi:MAG TPA: hypothetical protein VGT60_11965 [Candidatus Limnocylindria bacterium]|nr:hypothetical protein [Candidatus Limnocylindria bacterium]
MRSLAVRAARLAAGIVVFALLFALVRWWDFALPSFGAARYQAVFLSNGQTYFGRYIDRIGPYVKIDGAYYIQQTPTATEDHPNSPPESKLTRRGTELLHQPLPFVLIPKTAILFVEDLRPDSAVAQFIIKDGGGK